MILKTTTPHRAVLSSAVRRRTPDGDLVVRAGLCGASLPLEQARRGRPVDSLRRRRRHAWRKVWGEAEGQTCIMEAGRQPVGGMRQGGDDG